MMNRAETNLLRLTVVIPAFNEERRIAPTLERISAYLVAQPYAAEVIVVDDGSTDLTVPRAEAALRAGPSFRILSRAVNRGKGAAVRDGVLAAAGEFILVTDADLSTPIEELAGFWPEIEAGADVVIGSRALPGSDVQVHQSAVRETMGKAFNVFVRFLVMRGYRDTQCGFKLFRAAAAKDIFSRLRTEGFSFDVEVLWLCRKLGYAVRQVPVCWRNSPESRVRLVRGSLAMLRDLWRIRRSR
jgi:dolichyl-phosphate beta-glucosyltransferase